MSWKSWRSHFERNHAQPLPELTAPALPTEQRLALAWSLARFQLGEAGEGRIAREIRTVRLPGIDDDYREALGFFVREEGRHARILAGMIGALGASLLHQTWTERLFVFGRRLAGVRLKLTVLLAAEVVSIAFYAALARALPAGSFRAALDHIIEEERTHLRFHRDFFRSVASAGASRWVFLTAWWAVGVGASAIVLWDHRRTLRRFRISSRSVARSLALLLVAAVRAPRVREPATFLAGVRS
jgi:hypothetical protein